MTYNPISYTLLQYEDYPNWWLKAYEQGTTTGKNMALDSAGTSAMAKAEIDSVGFPITSGSVRFNPYIDGAYDLWIFPTEAEADADDTSNAIQLADNMTPALNAASTATAPYATQALLAAAITSNDIGSTFTTTEHTTDYGYQGGNAYIVEAHLGTETYDTGSEIRGTVDTTVKIVGLFPNGHNAMQFGASPQGASLDNSSAFLAYATWLATKNPDYGGYTLYFPAPITRNFYRFDTGIDFGTIFNLTTPATQRLTQLWLEGDGRGSHLRYYGSGSFAFNYGSYSANVGMTGGARKLKVDSTATIGHTSTIYTPTFTSVTGAAYGCDNTTTTCFLGSTVLSPFTIEDCEISLFNKGVHFRNGFAPTIKDCNITKCNTGVEGSDLCTSLTIAGGNTIEECAVGLFANACQQIRSSGVNVIEANDVDVLLYAGAHLITLENFYFEGSRRSVFISADGTTDQFTARQIKFKHCIGMDFELNGGLLECEFEDCAFSGGAIFGVNTSQRLKHITFIDCYSGNRGEAFDLTTITGSGLFSTYQDEIRVISKGVEIPHATGADASAFPSSQLVIAKNGYVTSVSATAEKAFGVVVANPTTDVTGRIEITGYRKAPVSGDMRMYSFKYVGVFTRDNDANTVTSWSTAESFVHVHTSTGANVPVGVTTPGTTINGAATVDQTIDIEFAVGTAVSGTADTYYRAVMYIESGDISFE